VPLDAVSERLYERAGQSQTYAFGHGGEADAGANSQIARSSLRDRYNSMLEAASAAQFVQIWGST